MTTQEGNTAIGANALGVGAGGCNNTAVGNDALMTSFGNNNIALGYCSAPSITTGSSNTFIGYFAGNNVSTCNFNVAIGNCVTVPDTNGSCQLAIGFGVLGCCWLTGNSTKAIKPGAGIIDCANSCGTAGQVLASTGSNALQWASVSCTVSSIANAGVALSLGNIKVQLSTTGNRSLQLGTVSGTACMQVQSSFCQDAGFGTIKSEGSYTTTPTLISSGWSFVSPAAVQNAVIAYFGAGTTPTAFYCVSMQIGPSYLNNMLCITRIA
jgi:hypothetical protein